MNDIAFRGNRRTEEPRDDTYSASLEQNPLGPGVRRRFFEIGYLDHVGQRIIRVSMRNITFERGDSFSFRLEDETGEVVTIPYHRIRQVYRNGTIIWERPV